MRSLNIEIYWDKFRQGGLTNGAALAAVTMETLMVCTHLFCNAEVNSAECHLHALMCSVTVVFK